jgi:hypothetical protein
MFSVLNTLILLVAKSFLFIHMHNTWTPYVLTNYAPCSMDPHI